jgi:ribosomal-protein-alanine N-acetyltransferase
MSALKVFSQFPIIDVNEEFILRQHSQDDCEAYLEYISDEETQIYVPDECIPKTLDQTKNEVQYNLDLYNYKRSVYWALARKSDNKLIGSCGFNYWNRDHSRGEISYDLARPYWGKGIMSIVAKKVVEYAFIHMEMHRIEATVTPSNTGSLKVLKRLGFQREGLLREQKLLHGKFNDAVILSLLKKEVLGF